MGHFDCHPKGQEYTDAERVVRLEQASIIYGWFTDVANRYGYAIARHGSAVRDIDLVAIPWTAETTMTATELVLKLCAALTLTMGNYTYNKPHGRASFAMWFHEWPDHQIDLSVMPLRPVEP